MTQSRMLELSTRVVLGLALVAPTLGAQTMGTGAFPDTLAIEKYLRRGEARKADVQRLLGVPNGTGRADMFPYETVKAFAVGEGTREIWYYEDIEVTGMKSSGGGGMTMKLRQQILLVFFLGDNFDGFLWTTNSVLPAAQQGGAK